MAKRIRTVPLPLHAGLAAALLAAAVALAFFWVPNDADQGFSQRIFYIHVPIALTAYACFGWGAWKAFVHLWKRTPTADLESYVAIHLGVIFGALTLLTGSIWAKISLGRLVDVELRPARALPRPVPLLRGLLHAPLLGRAGAGAGEHVARSTRSSAWR